MSMREHMCLDGKMSTEYSWWTYDGRGIALCRVCDTCKREKLSKYRPEILSSYSQNDVDEIIDEDY